MFNGFGITNHRRFLYEQPEITILLFVVDLPKPFHQNLLCPKVEIILEDSIRGLPAM